MAHRKTQASRNEKKTIFQFGDRYTILHLFIFFNHMYLLNMMRKKKERKYVIENKIFEISKSSAHRCTYLKKEKKKCKRIIYEEKDVINNKTETN